MRVLGIIIPNNFKATPLQRMASSGRLTGSFADEVVTRDQFDQQDDASHILGYPCETKYQ
ncbi:MAG TPA: hypothetical protein VGS11_12485 [Candidatus Bathyarchaeia archaeon]|nr:hypothetical protein [Candidatus Bathyarchaeia archaeon]